MKRITYAMLLIANCIVCYGIGRYGTTPPAKAVERRPEVQTFEVNAYCQKSCCCGKWADGVTASGHRIKPGDAFVAAPKSIPFGTMVIVPGYADGRPVPVLDRGSAITENRLDLYFDDADGKTGHQRAREWGRQTLQVTFPDKEKRG